MMLGFKCRWVLIVLLVMCRCPVKVQYLHAPPPDDAYWDGRAYPEGHKNYGLSVPFYLYSGGGFDAFTSACKRPQFS